jgi:ArsR family metal-binding transcriptional regulator
MYGMTRYLASEIEKKDLIIANKESINNTLRKMQKVNMDKIRELEEANMALRNELKNWEYGKYR